MTRFDSRRGRPLFRSRKGELEQSRGETTVLWGGEHDHETVHERAAAEEQRQVAEGVCKGRFEIVRASVLVTCTEQVHEVSRCMYREREQNGYDRNGTLQGPVQFDVWPCETFSPVRRETQSPSFEV